MSPRPSRARPLLLAVPALNLVALGLGLGAILLPAGSAQGSVAGAAFLALLMVNPAVAACFVLGGRAPQLRWRKRATAYLAVVPPALLAMAAGNFRLSNEYEIPSATGAATGILVFAGYAVICLLGAWLGLTAVRASGDRRRDDETASRALRAGRIAGIALSLALLAFAGLMGALVLVGGRVGHGLAWYAIAGAPLSLFWGAIGLHAGVLAALLLSPGGGAKTRRPLSATAVALGAAILAVHLLPLASLPVYLSQSRQAFGRLLDAAGPRLRRPGDERLPKGFMDRPFSLTGYFLGVRPQHCEIIRDVQFFRAEDAALPQDRDLELYFDAYLPLDEPQGPGRRPVLIRIHGGGWRLGDKGMGNMMQVNRHFAAQGYAVFDVQYGLKGNPEQPPVITPSHVLGPFGLDDMMRHLGYFARYLEEHADDYGADLDAVFVSGGSAGGQLACALALALSEGLEPSLFGSSLTVRGLVPFYPANGVSDAWIGGDSRWRSPEGLVRDDSPPCLVFQGAQDAMVPPETSRRLCRAYAAAGNPSCAVLSFPFAPHAADLYFPAYYSQVFLYFMERFLYAVRSDG